MNMTTRPLRARTALPRALFTALQWRLLLLWMLTTLLCALVASLPVWGWLSGQLDHSLHAQAIADGKAPSLLLDALLSADGTLTVLGSNVRVAGLLMLLASPLLSAATVVAARSRAALGFGELLRGAIGEFWPMLRLLLWSVLPLGTAIAVMAMGFGINEKMHEHAILAADVDFGRNLAIGIGVILLVLAHAGIEAGRGWMAADARLRSAMRAWWRGMRLLFKRPIAVLSAYLVPTALSLLLMLVVVAVRQHLASGSWAGFLLGLVLGCAITASLAWGKVARVFTLRALAEDAHTRR
ncbi:MAG: hypothetical protein KGL91_07960 [Xanthomonadaceae bacterium]|nr:hypothetical protein [Xanthomonadaceae bacterium]